MKPIRTGFIVALLFLANVSFALAQGTMKINVDATDAARNIVHSRLSIPDRPGPLTIIYPKWIPVDYHGGQRYPHLERDNTKPDVIADVIKSRAR